LDIHFVADFFIKGGTFLSRRAHTPVAGKILRRLVRGLLQLPNMTMEFHYPVGDRAGNGSHRFCNLKISENFCGIFVLLC
jgi:hypothetical protein